MAATKHAGHPDKSGRQRRDIDLAKVIKESMKEYKPIKRIVTERAKKK